MIVSVTCFPRVSKFIFSDAYICNNLLFCLKKDNLKVNK